MQANILLATTTWFAMPSRVAMALSKAGARVSAIYPKGSPVTKVSCVDTAFRYSARRPLHSLAESIRTVAPDLIIPCDDRVVEHLHQLYEKSAQFSNGQQLRRLIETSLGKPSGYSVTSSRGKLLEMAKGLGIRVPQTDVVRGVEQLHSWLREYGFPAVLKADGTWGGSGVRVVHSRQEAELAYAQLSGSASLLALLEQISGHDFYQFFSKMSSGHPEVTIQRYVDGVSANSMFTCWQGKVIDDLSIETLLSVHQLGSSTIVRTIDNPEMTGAGRALVGALGMSGFCGLDFLIENRTGAIYLIELNPRVTQIGHLEPGGRASLVSTLLRCLGPADFAGSHQPFVSETIAFFPHSLRCAADSPYLALADLRYDIPWKEPALIRELMRKSWNRRHLSAYFYAIVRKILTFSRSRLFQKSAKRYTPDDVYHVGPARNVDK